MIFKDRKLNSMTFQALKMKFLNSKTFQVFHDLDHPVLKTVGNEINYLLTKSNH